MKFLLRLLLSLAIAWLLVACTPMRVPNSLFYQFTDNPSVNLLEWEYADDHQIYRRDIGNGIGRISFTAARVGEFLKIKWYNRVNGEIKSEKIPLNQGLPFNMREAKIRLTFNDKNQPEVYIFYNGPSPYSFFWFKGRPYSQVRVRQIYPTIQEMKINTNHNNN